MTKRLLLINPPVHDFAAFDLFARPHGLLYIGAYLRECGYEIALLDCLDRNHPAMVGLARPKSRTNGCGKYFAQRLEKPALIRHVPRYYYNFGMPSEIFRQQLAIEKAKGVDVVLVTSIMTYWYPAVAQAISDIRAIMPQTPILLGGIYASLMLEHAQRICQPDEVLATGDMATICKAVDRYCNSETATLPPADFSNWPAPAYDLYHKLDYISILSSLGCCYRCEYCATSILQPRFQQATPEKIVGEILQLSKLLTNQQRLDVAFQDDALLVNAETRFMPILQKLIESGLPFKLHSPNGLHCRLISPEIARLMFQAGFEMIRLSYEASDDSPEYQAASDNKVNDSFFQQAIKNLVQAGFNPSQIEAYILNGLPGQTMHQMEQSALAVNRCGIKARLCQFTPIPGTKMFNFACQLMNIPTDEPLLHNNSLMLTRASDISDQQFQKFKDRVNELNSKL